MAGVHTISLAFSFILSLTSNIAVNAYVPSVDVYEDCPEWAYKGQCKPNGRPAFMYKNCPQSCHQIAFKESEHKNIADDQEGFYDLSAKTANGKVISMENFEGSVIVIVNAARVCDYSKVFFDKLEHMHSLHPYSLEILAFPFHHPETNIESCRDALEAYEKKEGHKIHIMKAINTHGKDTHPIYKYLKGVFDMEFLDPDYPTYFFITADGTLIESHFGTDYNMLKSFVVLHMNADYKNTDFGNEF